MTMTLKEAADSLLKKGDITQKEYDSINLEKIAAVSNIGATIQELINSKNVKGLKNLTKLLLKDIQGEATNEALGFKEVRQEAASQLAKNKGISDTLKGSLRDLWVVPATVGTALVAKEGVIDPLIQQHKVQKSFEQVSKQFPDLEKEDQAKIKDYFDVIKTYSPYAAANPLVAGALVNKMMEWQGVDHKLVQDLVNIQGGKQPPESVKTFITGGLKGLTQTPKGEE